MGVRVPPLAHPAGVARASPDRFESCVEIRICRINTIVLRYDSVPAVHARASPSRIESCDEICTYQIYATEFAAYARAEPDRIEIAVEI